MARYVLVPQGQEGNARKGNRLQNLGTQGLATCLEHWVMYKELTHSQLPCLGPELPNSGPSSSGLVRRLWCSSALQWPLLLFPLKPLKGGISLLQWRRRQRKEIHGLPQPLKADSLSWLVSNSALWQPLVPHQLPTSEGSYLCICTTKNT